MIEFNLQQTGNALLQLLEKKLGSKNIFRLSLDVQLPAYLLGDEQGLYNSIIRICTHFNAALVNGIVDIEILKVEQFNSSIRINVDVRGSDSNLRKPYTATRHNPMEIENLLKELPDESKFSSTSFHDVFSFRMTFHRSSAIVEESRPFANKSILLAEDNDLNALVFASFIEEWGCQITKAANGLEAVATAGAADFDLILMDIHMPEMSGNEAISKIRQFNKSIPIIALTASSLKSDITNSLEVGANDFLLKPVSGHQLKKMLIKYF